MTVSRVINRRENVGPDTRERVEAAIRQLDYAPNPAASSLARSQAVRIALLYGNPSAAYLGAFLVGGLEQCRRSNLQLIVEQYDTDDEAESVARRLIAGGVDGIILPPPLCDSERVIRLLARSGMPAVAVATDRPADSLSTISIDDFRAALEMTRHLIALGHRRIGFITGHPNQSASERRLAGFRQAIADAGIEPDKSLVVPGLFTYRSGLDAAEQLLELRPRPTAIFASNDDMAAAAVAVAHRRGLDIPADLTVCGFDDTAMATMIDPELTTIRQPIADMASAAVRLLIDEIRRTREGEAERHPHMLIDHELIRRQSDAAPRQRPRVQRLPLPKSASR
jgi:LacI family transcriptional regulator